MIAYNYFGLQYVQVVYNYVYIFSVLQNCVLFDALHVHYIMWALTDYDKKKNQKHNLSFHRSLTPLWFRQRMRSNNPHSLARTR